MNRQQRRQAERQQRYDLNRLPREKALDLIDAKMAVQRELERNGITVKDLERNYDIGYQAGIKDTTSLVTRSSYAAAIIALRRRFGFGQKRMKRFLEEMDSQLEMCITRDDLIEQAWDECRLKLVDNEAFERIQEA